MGVGSAAAEPRPLRRVAEKRASRSVIVVKPVSIFDRKTPLEV